MLHHDVSVVYATSCKRGFPAAVALWTGRPSAEVAGASILSCTRSLLANVSGAWHKGSLVHRHCSSLACVLMFFLRHSASSKVGGSEQHPLRA